MTVTAPLPAMSTKAMLNGSKAAARAHQKAASADKNAATIAIPPPRGVGVSWELRTLGTSRIACRNAWRRATPVATQAKHGGQNRCTKAILAARAHGGHKHCPSIDRPLCRRSGRQRNVARPFHPTMPAAGAVREPAHSPHPASAPINSVTLATSRRFEPSSIVIGRFGRSRAQREAGNSEVSGFLLNAALELRIATAAWETQIHEFNVSQRLGEANSLALLQFAQKIEFKQTFAGPGVDREHDRQRAAGCLRPAVRDQGAERTRALSTLAEPMQRHHGIAARR